MPPNETRVSNPADPKAETTCSFVVTGEETAESPAVPSPAGEPNNPTRQVSRYQIRKRLGEGGFGSVFLAFDPTLARDVALKLPRDPSSWTDEKAQRFLEEARNAARLKHPHVITVYDAGRCDSGGVFIAMEYVEGNTLADRLARGKLDVPEAVRFCSQVANAIHEGHKLGLVHRDLKPSNILIDSAGNAKICDFGLALHEDSQGDRRGEVSGTLSYMSPEQARGESHLLDGRSDVWSLGVILYECLSGRRPFRGKNRAELFEDIQTRDARPLRQVDDSIPEPLDALCRKCLARKLSDRLATALDFQRALTDLESGGSVRKRTRFAWATLAFTGVVLAAGVTALFFGPPSLQRPPKGEPPKVAAPADSVALHDGRESQSTVAPRAPPRFIDLLARSPESVVIASDGRSPSFYDEITHRLTVTSSYWSLFACRTHEGDMWLDVTVWHGTPPAWAGVLWGLKLEPAPPDVMSQRTCLAAMVRPVAVVSPDTTPDENAAVCLLLLTITQDRLGNPANLSTKYLATTKLHLDWTIPIRLRARLGDGELREVQIQGKPVRMPSIETGIDWTTFSKGECGFVTFQAKDRVEFTSALLQP